MEQETVSQEVASTESRAPAEVTTESTPSTTTEQEIASTEAQIQAFQPDFKFKVMDEEKEFDEFLRPVIKDADTQKKIKELYEKAYGLDYVKPKYEGTKKELEAIKPQFQAISNDLKLVGQHLKNQDLGSFFKTFNLTDEQVLEYAVKRLEYLEAPPEKRQQIDKELQFKGQHASISLENEQLKAYKEQQEATVFHNEFKTALSTPEVQSIVQSFDTRAGKQGAFAQAIIQHGMTQSRLAGQDLPVQAVVQSFIQTFGLTPQPSQAASMSQVPTSSGEPAQRKETLPRVQGTGVSPVAQKVKSLDDLKALQNKAFSTGHG
jgi:hypothetical protein